MVKKTVTAEIIDVEEGFAVRRSDGSIRVMGWFESVMWILLNKKPKDCK